MADVSAANELAAFLRKRNVESLVSPSQSVTLEDLRSRPSVVIGGFGNEWSVRLGENLRFHFHRDTTLGTRWIEDAKNPAYRRWAMDVSQPYNQIGKVYALITRAQDASTGQWWIGLGALTGLGSLTVEQLVVDPAKLAALTAQLPRGWEHKNLQLVIEIEVINGSAGASHVVASELW